MNYKEILRSFAELENKLKMMEEKFQINDSGWIKIFINEICSKPPQNKYPTNKSDDYHIDDIWSLDIVDLKEYGPEKNRRYRYVLLIIDNLSKFGSTIPLKNNLGTIIKDSFENILISSKRSPILIETDTGKEFYDYYFENFLNINSI